MLGLSQNDVELRKHTARGWPLDAVYVKTIFICFSESLRTGRGYSNLLLAPNVTHQILIGT